MEQKIDTFYYILHPKSNTFMGVYDDEQLAINAYFQLMFEMNNALKMHHFAMIGKSEEMTPDMMEHFSSLASLTLESHILQEKKDLKLGYDEIKGICFNMHYENKRNHEYELCRLVKPAKPTQNWEKSRGSIWRGREIGVWVEFGIVIDIFRDFVEYDETDENDPTPKKWYCGSKTSPHVKKYPCPLNDFRMIFMQHPHEFKKTSPGEPQETPPVSVDP